MSNADSKRLTVLVKRFLDLIWFVLLTAAIVWPIAVLVVGLSVAADPGRHSADVDAYLHFRINSAVSGESATESASAGETLLRGRGQVQIQNMPSTLAWYVSGAITEIMGIIFLFGLAQARKLFGALAEGEWFAGDNAGLIRKIGYVFIGWHILHPLMQFFGGRTVLNDLAFDVPGVQLFAGFQLNILGILAGLAIIVLAGVWREAIEIHQEQELTI